MTAKLAAALAAFQAEMPTVAKAHRADVPTKSGSKYTYTYADLADVTEAAMPLLAKHGLSFSACPRATERGYELVGRLLHTSGEDLEGALPIAGNTPQEMGSSLTYMRRYLLGCMTGLVTDDDDDGRLAASKPPRKARTETRTMSRGDKTAPESPMLNTSSTLAKRMFAALGNAGITDKANRLDYVSSVVGRTVASSAEMTDADAEAVIDALAKLAASEVPDPHDGSDPWVEPDSDERTKL